MQTQRRHLVLGSLGAAAIGLSPEHAMAYQIALALSGSGTRWPPC
mgnify:CR=1 FL=1